MRLRARRHRRNLRPPEGLRITSMMDILTVLLLFLLKSFVAEGEAVTPAPGVELPRSESEDRPPASLVIAITDDAINLGEETVAVLDGSVDGGSAGTSTSRPWAPVWSGHGSASNVSPNDAATSTSGQDGSPSRVIVT